MVEMPKMAHIQALMMKPTFLLMLVKLVVAIVAVSLLQDSHVSAIDLNQLEMSPGSKYPNPHDVLAFIGGFLLEKVNDENAKGPFYISFLNSHILAFIYIVLGGYVLILTMQIVSRIIEKSTSKELALLWNLLGALLWLAASVILLQVYIEGVRTLPYKENKKISFLASGTFTLLNGLLFLIAIPLTYAFD